MSRSKEEILLKETSGIFDEYEGGITGIFNAMDVYFEERAMELLSYLAKNKVICHNDEQGDYFNTRGETLTKEQIFENFL